MADLLSLQQITELREAFGVFDKDGDGNITTADLADVFAALGQRVSAERLNELMAVADIDVNGVVDFAEFLALVAQRLKDPDSRELELRRAFAQYDVGGTGYITPSNLELVMRRLGCPLTPAQAYEMIAEADLDGDGRLSYTEFRRVMLSASFPM